MTIVIYLNNKQGLVNQITKRGIVTDLLPSGQIGQNRIFVPGYIGAAGASPAVPTGQVISRIEGVAVGTGIILHHFGEPLFISCLLNTGLRFPQLQTVRPGRLELLEVSARIVGALPAEVQPFFGGTMDHFTGPAVERYLVRTAAVTLNLFDGVLDAFGQFLQSVRVGGRTDVEGAGRAKQPTHGG